MSKEVRHKIMIGIQKSPVTFSGMKRKSVYGTHFIVNTKKIGLNEKDIRFIFLHLDPNKRFYIFREMIEWAKTGEIPTESSKHRPQPVFLHQLCTSPSRSCCRYCN